MGFLMSRVEILVGFVSCWAAAPRRGPARVQTKILPTMLARGVNRPAGRRMDLPKSFQEPVSVVVFLTALGGMYISVRGIVSLCSAKP